MSKFDVRLEVKFAGLEADSYGHAVAMATGSVAGFGAEISNVSARPVAEPAHRLPSSALAGIKAEFNRYAEADANVENEMYRRGLAFAIEALTGTLPTAGVTLLVSDLAVPDPAGPA